MPVRVIHFGPDDCHRLMVLESAGYAVENCDCLAKLPRLLADSAEMDAVLVSEGNGVSLPDVVAMVENPLFPSGYPVPHHEPRV